MKKYCLIFIVLISISCGKADEGYIPNVSVYYTSLLSDPNLNRLTSIGGAVSITGYGVCGLIIYHSPNGYVAYDRCSSYQPEKRCAVTIDDPSLTVTDPCSGSKFSLNDGSPVKAPATRSLKSYSVSSQNNAIIVSN